MQYLQSLVASRRHAQGTLINYERDLDRLTELSSSADSLVDLANLTMHDIRRCMILYCPLSIRLARFLRLVIRSRPYSLEPGCWIESATKQQAITKSIIRR
jgi:site-specific recombinase XerC